MAGFRPIQSPFKANNLPGENPGIFWLTFLLDFDIILMSNGAIMELELVKFIRKNADWENLLQQKPYCLTISRDNLLGKNLIMFKYSQIDSDFSQEIVKESRGLILEEGTWEIVSYPFRKFMNYGEPTADQIDWNTVTVTEKVDGSLMKIVRLGNDLLISTNGTIDAFKAPIPEQVGCKYSSFGELALDILKARLGENYVDKFQENETYMFELVSPWTRVVIPYAESDLYFLGVRNNRSLQERSFMGESLPALFKTPKVYSFSSFEDCVQNASQLPWDAEGYVVNDANFNRVKVKSVAWIQVHHLKDNGGILSYARCLELIRMNEVGEVLNYFPEFKDAFQKVEDVYDKFVGQDEAAWEYLCQEFDLENTPRKDLAIWIQKNFNLPGVGFAMLDKKVSSVKEWYQNCNIDKLVGWLGFK